jgi:Glycosyltransferase family 20
VGLVTPLRDGMDLVAKEYVASQNPDDPGVLILSRFAGAAHECRTALLVNPYDPHSVAAAIGQALSMPLAERRKRHDALFRVLSHNDIQHWADRFLATLEHEPTALSQLRENALCRIVISPSRPPSSAFSGWDAALHSYAPVVEEAWFDARPRQPVVRIQIMELTGMGGYGLNCLLSRRKCSCSRWYRRSFRSFRYFL